MSGDSKILQHEYRRIQSPDAYGIMPHRKPPNNITERHVKTVMKPSDSTEPQVSTDDETEEECIISKKDGGGKKGKKNKDSSNDGGKQIMKDVGAVVLATALISGGIIGGVALALPAIGFGSLGVTAGSLAAAYQSSVLGGTIAAGSGFATLQSIGAIGLSAAVKTGIVAGSAAVSTAATSVYRKIKDKIKKE